MVLQTQSSNSENERITFVQHGNIHQYMAESLGYKEVSHYLGNIASARMSELIGLSRNDRLFRLMQVWLEDLGYVLMDRNLYKITKRHFSLLSDDEILHLEEEAMQTIQEGIYKEIQEIFVQTVKDAFQCDYVAKEFAKSRKMTAKEMDRYAEFGAPGIGLSHPRDSLHTRVDRSACSYLKGHVKKIKKSRQPHNRILSHLKSL